MNKYLGKHLIIIWGEIVFNLIYVESRNVVTICSENILKQSLNLKKRWESIAISNYDACFLGTIHEFVRSFKYDI